MQFSRCAFSVALTAFLLSFACEVIAAEDGPAQPPEVGQEAPDFQLKALDGKEVRLKELVEQGPVALVVLRGYPGYQCPICSGQVSDLSFRAADFRELGAQVVMVYPGPSARLDQRATEFLKEEPLPEPLTLVTDPDYKFTNLYGLRWDAPRETAYPSTFVIGTDGKVRFSKVSKSHGGRADTKTILAAIRAIDAPAKTPRNDLERGEFVLKPFSEDFQRLAAIAGAWKGQMPTHDGSGTMEVEVEYRLTAGNSAIVERLFKDSPMEMMSLYHDDGDGILMTHYCMLGNQPRMRAKGFESDRLSFAFVSGTNMPNEDEPHMRTLTLTILGPDHIRHEWQLYQDGKPQPDHSAKFDLHRVRE